MRPNKSTQGVRGAESLPPGYIQPQLPFNVSAIDEPTPTGSRAAPPSVATSDVEQREKGARSTDRGAAKSIVGERSEHIAFSGARSAPLGLLPITKVLFPHLASDTVLDISDASDTSRQTLPHGTFYRYRFGFHPIRKERVYV